MSAKFPDPAKYNNWVAWAKDLERVLRQSEAMKPVNPTVILLEHMVADRPASAAVDGLLMFDPTLGCPVYSHDGEWHPVTGV